MIKVRGTKSKDYKEIYDLLESEDMNINDFTKLKFLDMLKRNKKGYFVALNGKKIIGNIFSNYDGGNYVYIYKLVVDKNYRKKEIATLLIKKILNRYNKKNIWIYCHINKNNKPSINTFMRLGFKIRKKHRLFDVVIK